MSLCKLERPWFLSNEVAREGSTWGLHEGELFLPCAPAVITATSDALERGLTRYDCLQGLAELRDKICENASTIEGQCISPDQILVSNGSTQAIFQLFQCLIEEGDRVLVPRPGWGAYRQGILRARGVVAEYSCTDHELDSDHVAWLCRRGAKLIVVNSPHNPTGAVIGRESMRRLLDVASRYGIYVLSDEAYMGLSFPGVDSPTAWSECDFSQGNVIVSRTFSKAFSMTGYRIGYICANSRIIEKCAILQACLTDNACTFAQYGALAAAGLPRRYVEERALMLAERMTRTIQALDGMPMLTIPRGGFYCFIDVRRFIGFEGSSRTIARNLVEEQGVRVVPGEEFGMPGYLRISIAYEPEPRFTVAISRLNRFFESYSAK